ncbi:MAG: type 1 fimbrial protein [Stenotrophomonas sp.]|jgi:type 1 fimbria pilin|uniref:fimbrial protein n=1 Tax=Stenotrophomonas sp. TaxID=69392 RepID=UPI002843AC79|nr:fimbrial protein [Stenotrophomonas sp.]MDR2957924.1 type 1 fimbrial protein [Stenotrophomonas sp.]
MKTSALLLAALTLGATSHAYADSATITVTGKVLPGTCTMADVPVALADIDATNLSNGHDNNLTPATLDFTGCVGVARVDLVFDGAEDSAQDGHWLNQSAGGASGVAVALLDGSTGTTFLKKGATRSLPVDGAASATLNLRAGYYRQAGTPLKAGEVSSQITVTADYR